MDRRFRVKRDHPDKGWKAGQELTEAEIDQADVDKLTQTGVLEKVNPGGSAEGGQSQQTRGGGSPGQR